MRKSHHFRQEFRKHQKEQVIQSHSWHVLPSLLGLQAPPRLERASGKTGAQEGKWRGHGHPAKDGEMELDLCPRPPDWGPPPTPYLHTPHCSVQNSNQQPDSTVWEPAWHSGREERDRAQRKGIRIIHTQGYKAERTLGSEGQSCAKMP